MALKQKMHLKLKKGGLHRATGTPAGEKVPESKVQKGLHSSNEHMREMAQFAENASHWNKGKK
jgi:hypothetical protein